MPTDKGRYLGLVESPLQLLCLQEAVRFFGIADWAVFIRYSDMNRVQIQKVLDIFPDLKPHVLCSVYIGGAKKALFDYLKILGVYSFFFLMARRFSHILIGDYFSPFFKPIYRLFDKKKQCLIDDGTSSIVIQHFFSDLTAVDFFTFFEFAPFKHQTLYPNRFSYLKQRFSHITYTDESILYLGAEPGLKNPDDYFNLFQHIVDQYSDKSVVYIPHRQESPEKLALIVEKFPKVRVQKLDYPVELFGLFNDSIPTQIVSFMSTALLTLSVIYDKVSVQAYKFPGELLKEEAVPSSLQWAKEAETVYEYLEKHIPLKAIL